MLFEQSDAVSANGNVVQATETQKCIIVSKTVCCLFVSLH